MLQASARASGRGADYVQCLAGGLGFRGALSAGRWSSANVRPLPAAPATVTNFAVVTDGEVTGNSVVGCAVPFAGITRETDASRATVPEPAAASGLRAWAIQLHRPASSVNRGAAAGSSM